MNPDDLKQLTGAFMAETEEFLQVLESSLLSLEQHTSFEQRSQAVKQLFRTAHSIKGSAAMFQFKELAKAAHQLENCFALLRDRADLQQLKPKIITALLAGTDHLKTIVQHLEEADWDTEVHLKALIGLQTQLETEYGMLKADMPPPATQAPANQEIIKSIFRHELPLVLDELEAELSQAHAEDINKTLQALSKVHYQLAGMATVLQLEDFRMVVDRLETLGTLPKLSIEMLQADGWDIAQALRQARDEILQGKPIQPIIDQPDAVADIEAASSELSIATLTSPQPAAGLEAKAATATTTPTTQQGWQRPTIRVDVERLTELVNLVGELVINRTNLELQETQLRTEMKRLRQSINDLRQSGGHLREEYDRMSLNRPTSTSYAVTNKLAESVAFDPLEMDQYTEFHTTAQGVIETTHSIENSAGRIDQLTLQFESSIDQLQYITEHLRNRVMQLRVVSFSRAVDHLPRALRDLCRHYNKEVNLVLLGRDTKIDESLLDALRDPLVHLVRNAFDHGIESPEMRAELGKPPNGQIEIEAYHQAGQTIITVTDDGQGIDPEILRHKIVAKGLVDAEQAQALSNADLYEFLFWPGFSTLEQVTDLSGRGVGLDIVRTNLRQVRGNIRIDSRPGKGTSFILKLPLMLSITEALMVQTDHNIIAIPMDAVEEILHIRGHHIHTAGQQPMIGWRDEFIRLVRLQDLLKFHANTLDAPSPDPMTQDYIPVIVLASSEGVVAVVVEKLLGRQEIVIKPIPSPLAKPKGIVGSTILGNGAVVTILDADDLVGQTNTNQGTGVTMSDRQTQVLAPVPESQPQILVVDDSYTIRQLLMLTLTRARYRVVQAKDGQDAWEQLQAGLNCHLIIADIEMPRMDGFELLRSIKAQSNLAHIPIAMLTSRSGAKHRQMAMDLGANHYFTKPYNEVQLLEVIHGLIQQSVPMAAAATA